MTNAFEAFIKAPRCGEVYNLGGGRQSNASILESIALIEELSGRKVKTRMRADNRTGDHICYISDLSKMKNHYKNWSITKNLESTFEEIAQSWEQRIKSDI